MKSFPLELVNDVASDEADIRPDGYSGRGMYGQTCASVTFEGLAEALLFFAELGIRVGEEAADENSPHPGVDSALTDMLRSVNTDSMGRGVIVYFPGYTFV